MQRVATLMLVREGLEERYCEEHRNIWPEVVTGITKYGIRNYSIFMRGRTLFSFLEVADLDASMAMAAADPANQRWQEHMAPLMDVGSGVKDGSTVYLDEVFRSEGHGGAMTYVERVATYMQVKPSAEEAYREAHQNVWPEILEGIERVKIRNYSIFMRGRDLYSYFEVEDLDKAMAALAGDPINQRWQEQMAPLMDVGSGVRDSTTEYLEEVFHLD